MSVKGNDENDTKEDQSFKKTALDLSSHPRHVWRSQAVNPFETSYGKGVDDDRSTHNLETRMPMAEVTTWGRQDI